jgi:hypothetical protein
METTIVALNALREKKIKVFFFTFMICKKQ